MPMKDENKSKEQLINELSKLRQRVCDFDKLELEYKQEHSILEKSLEELERKVEEQKKELTDINDRLRIIVESAQGIAVCSEINEMGRLLLEEFARTMAADLGLLPVCHNPFMFNAAQLVECVHVTREAIDLIKELLDTDEDSPAIVEAQPKAGEGVSAVEVPRGILYHHYEYDGKGRIARADCVIPTTQNNANIHLDIKALVSEFALRGTTDKELERLCSMLVRAYDPCISCSVH